MFTKRLVSGIILVILAIIVVGKGGALLYGVTALISLIGLFELYRVLKIEKNAMGIVGYLTAVSYYGLVWFDGHHYVTLMAIAALMVMMAIYVFTFPKYRTEENLSDRLCLSTVMIVTFIGMFLFVMLFEARARYLYNTIPVFSVMAVFGYYKLYRKLFIFCDKRRK